MAKGIFHFAGCSATAFATSLLAFAACKADPDAHKPSERSAPADTARAAPPPSSPASAPAPAASQHPSPGATPSVPTPDTVTASDSRFRFAFIVPDPSGFHASIKEVIVTSKSKGDTLQRWELPPENEGYAPAVKPSEYIPDVNFDGYSDIRILVNCGAGPNCVHLYYVFDGNKGLFARDTILEGIGSATFDAKAKTIRSFWRSGCCWHGEDTYRYVKGKPVLFIQKECRGDAGIEGKPYLSTVKVRKNGKMLLRKKRYLTEHYVSTVGFGW